MSWSDTLEQDIICRHEADRENAEKVTYIDTEVPSRCCSWPLRVHKSTGIRMCTKCKCEVEPRQAFGLVA